MKYELLVKGDGHAAELVYSASGKLLKTEAKGGEKEEKHAKKHEGEKHAKAKKHAEREKHEKGKVKKHDKEKEEDEDDEEEHERPTSK